MPQLVPSHPEEGGGAPPRAEARPSTPQGRGEGLSPHAEARPSRKESGGGMFCAEALPRPIRGKERNGFMFCADFSPRTPRRMGGEGGRGRGRLHHKVIAACICSSHPIHLRHAILTQFRKALLRARLVRDFRSFRKPRFRGLDPSHHGRTRHHAYGAI